MELGAVSIKEVCYFCGVTDIVVKNLAKQGIVTLYEQEVYRTPYEAATPTQKPELALTAQQQQVLDGLLQQYFGSQLSWPLFFIGLIFQMDILLTIGIVLFAAVVLFQLVTLPVEFNASSRALRTLESNYYLEPDEMVGAKKMLSAAAMTYVASLITAILQLFRLLAIAGNRRDD